MKAKIQAIDTHRTFDHEGFLNARGVGPILAETSCKFKFPLTYPDQVLATASISAEDVTERGFLMRYQVWSLTHDRLAADGTGTIISFDYGSGSVAPFPPVVTDAVAALEQDDNLDLLPELEKFSQP